MTNLAAGDTSVGSTPTRALSGHEGGRRSEKALNQVVAALIHAEKQASPTFPEARVTLSAEPLYNYPMTHGPRAATGAQCNCQLALLLMNLSL